MARLIEPDDVISYWPCDEGTGTDIADDVGGYDGTLTNPGTWDTGYKSRGSSIVSNGNNTYVAIDDITELDNIATASFALHVKFNTFDVASFLFKKGAFPAIQLTYNASNEIVFTSNNKSATSGTDILELKRWYRLLVVFEGSQADPTDRVRMYLDGKPLSITVAADFGATLPNTTTFKLMNSATSVEGRVANYVIWGIALTDLQARRDAKAMGRGIRFNF